MKYDKAICHGWGKKEIDENYLAIREMDAYKKWKKKYFHGKIS